jgi:hypothetical protein
LVSKRSAAVVELCRVSMGDWDAIAHLAVIPRPKLAV